MSTGKAILIGAVILIGVPIGCSYLGVLNKAATAPARVINKTLETDNIIFNYEYFFDMNAAFTSRSAQVKQYKDLYATETDKDEKIQLRTEMSAMQQSCRELATKYNANSLKLNRGLFKDKKLPYQLEIKECEQ